MKSFSKPKSLQFSRTALTPWDTLKSLFYGELLLCSVKWSVFFPRPCFYFGGKKPLHMAVEKEDESGCNNSCSYYVFILFCTYSLFSYVARPAVDIHFAVPTWSNH